MYFDHCHRYGGNPVLVPTSGIPFDCPIQGRPINWAEKAVFNPAVIRHKGVVYMFFRAEDYVGTHSGTSRIGLATSVDGRHFTVRPRPVLYPGHDDMFPFEWDGGCEDPRIIEREDGTFIMTYTAYNGELARLAVATSTDLVSWKKEGLAFPEEYIAIWSKSGAIVGKWQDEKLLAHKFQGKYFMYWGEGSINGAVSDDCIHWQPITKDGKLVEIIRPSDAPFDSALVEPGPPPHFYEDGILMVFNSKSLVDEHSEPMRSYIVVQATLDPKDPTKILDRKAGDLIEPVTMSESQGQIPNVCFAESIMKNDNEWLLYYGMADSSIGMGILDLV